MILLPTSHCQEEMGENVNYQAPAAYVSLLKKSFKCSVEMLALIRSWGRKTSDQ